MKLIVKAKAIVSEDNRKKMLDELLAMKEKGIILLDARYEENPVIIDSDTDIVIKTKIKKPEAGEHFNYNGIECVALGEEQGGILAVFANVLDEAMPFDESNCNDWRNSTLRKYLNEELLKSFNDGDLLPFVSDLVADNGEKDYETCEDYITILSCDLNRKYRELIPKYNTWVWTLTPWRINPDSYCDCCVNTSGSFDGGNANDSNGVAPACIFNPSIFE